MAKNDNLGKALKISEIVLNYMAGNAPTSSIGANSKNGIDEEKLKKLKNKLKKKGKTQSPWGPGNNYVN